MFAKKTEVTRVLSALPNRLNAKTEKPNFIDVCKEYEGLENADTDILYRRKMLQGLAASYEKESGPNAAIQCAQITSGYLLFLYKKKISVSISWPDSRAFSTLTFLSVPENSEFPSPDSLGLPKELPLPDQAYQHRNQKGHAFKAPPFISRSPFNPFTDLPDSAFMHLLKSWEDLFSENEPTPLSENQKARASQCALLHLMMWEEAEKNHSPYLAFTFHELGGSQGPLAPGKKIRIELSCRFLDPALPASNEFRKTLWTGCGQDDGS